MLCGAPPRPERDEPTEPRELTEAEKDSRVWTVPNVLSIARMASSPGTGCARVGQCVACDTCGAL